MANQHKYDVKITFQIVRTGQGFKEVRDELKKTEKANKTASRSIMGKWTELRSQLLLAKAAIREVTQAFKGAWNAARGGAELTQLTESFDRANAAIFQTPTLLNDMSAAARGTITEANLMSGIMTLTAGTSRELSQALTGNAADLLTIAKAANRLNPTLGDTDFFYQSLTTGIKRSSFRILDNLGIVVRVSEANRRWAVEMDRTVLSMSAEERQLALLNEVLRVGGRLVDQAGGSSESLTDSYDILKTMMQEVRNSGMQMLDQMFRPLIQSMADAQLAAGELRVELGEVFNERTEEGARDYAKALNEAKEAFTEWRDEINLPWVPILMDIAAANVRKQTKEAVSVFTDELLRALKESQPEGFIALGDLVVAGEGDFELEEFNQRVVDSTDALRESFAELRVETTLNGVVFGDQIITWQALIDALDEADAAYAAIEQRQFSSRQAAAFEQKDRTESVEL
jgi:hypothetical protein